MDDLTAQDVVDFDAMWAGRKVHRVRIAGKVYPIPNGPPIKTVLVMRRAAIDASGDIDQVPFDALVEMLAPVFGRDTIDSWFEGGMGLDQLGDVLKHVMSVWKPDRDDDGEEESGRPPQASTPPSSTGSTSRPTSSASTPSTWPRPATEG